MILQAWNLMWGWKLASQFTVTQISGFGRKILAVCHVHVGSISEFSRMGFFKRSNCFSNSLELIIREVKKRLTLSDGCGSTQLKIYATHLNGMVLFLCQFSEWKYTLFETPPLPIEYLTIDFCWIFSPQVAGTGQKSWWSHSPPQSLVILGCPGSKVRIIGL